MDFAVNAAVTAAVLAFRFERAVAVNAVDASEAGLAVVVYAVLAVDLAAAKRPLAVIAFALY